MRVLVQRSKSSSVLVDEKVVGKIDFGYVLLVGFTDTDTKEKIDKMVRKILHLRIFDDNNGVMNESILDHNGSILLVSQFTLYADTKKGNRPSYIKALNSKDGETIAKVVEALAKQRQEIYNKIFSTGGNDADIAMYNELTAKLEKLQYHVEQLHEEGEI